MTLSDFCFRSFSESAANAFAGVPFVHSQCANTQPVNDFAVHVAEPPSLRNSCSTPCTVGVFGYVTVPDGSIISKQSVLPIA